MGAWRIGDDAHGGDWLYPEKYIDGNPGTAAEYDLGANSWTSWIYILYDIPIYSNKHKYYAHDVSELVTEVIVEIYENGAWRDIPTSYVYNEWVEVEFGAYYWVEQIRIKYHNLTGASTVVTANEMWIWEGPGIYFTASPHIQFDAAGDMYGYTMAWTLAQGYEASAWTTEQNAYDGSLATQAEYYINPSTWSPWITLTYSPSVFVTKVRHRSGFNPTETTEAEIEVYDGTDWIPVSVGLLENVWNEGSVDSKIISKIRFRAHNTHASGGDPFDLLELQVWGTVVYRELRASPAIQFGASGLLTSQMVELVGNAAIEFGASGVLSSILVKELIGSASIEFGASGTLSSSLLTKKATFLTDSYLERCWGW